MLKRFLAPALLLCLVSPLWGQFLTPRYHSYLVSDVLYLEAFGNGIRYSLNYEQLFVSTEYFGASARIGGSAFPAGDRRVEFGVPITFSAFAGKGQVFGELGGGTTFRFDSRVLETGVQTLITGIAGVRIHPVRHGGIMLRLAYTPWYDPAGRTLHHLGGFALGIGLERR